MEGLTKKLVGMLVLLMAVAFAARLAWELLKPALPLLIAIVILTAILRAFWRRKRGW